MPQQRFRRAALPFLPPTSRPTGLLGGHTGQDGARRQHPLQRLDARGLVGRHVELDGVAVGAVPLHHQRAHVQRVTGLQHRPTRPATREAGA
jgi:hypothetical protein